MPPFDTYLPIGTVARMDGLLISDAERDQISDVLGEHMAEGRLTVDELEQRLGRLYAARTREQAAAVTAGLPALEPPAPEHHIHFGREHDGPFPTLPGWLMAPGIDGARPRPAGQVPAPAAPAPRSRAEEQAAARERAKRHADENAIGHCFQARRRAITAQLEAAIAAGNHEEATRLGGELRDAKDTAAAARRSLAAGDRAAVQRSLQLLRQNA